MENQWVYSQFTITCFAGSSGSFFHNFTIDEILKFGTRKFFLDVKAVDPNTGDSVTLRGAFRVFGHHENYFRSLNMINTGTSPIPQGGSLEFISVGNPTEFACKFDNGTMQPCRLIIILWYDHDIILASFPNSPPMHARFLILVGPRRYVKITHTSLCVWGESLGLRLKIFNMCQKFLSIVRGHELIMVL